MPYIIIDLSRSSKEKPMFWRPDNMGYTFSPFEAGLYEDFTVEQNWSYYNNSETVAVRTAGKDLEKCDLQWTVTWSPEKTLQLRDENKARNKYPNL